MGEAEETGGVQALRAWAGEAVGRARALMPGPDTVGTPSRIDDRAYDASVSELDALAKLLDHDPELRSSVTVWLGGALTLRHGAGRGTSEDRERAEGLLRDARDPASRIGAATSTEDRRWAALFLATHAVPVLEGLGGLPPEPDLTALFDMFARQDPHEMAAYMGELREWTAEAAELPLPPELRGQLRMALDLSAHPSVDAADDFLTVLIPDDSDPADRYLRQVLKDRLATVTGGANETGGSGGQADSAVPDPGDTSETPDSSGPAGAPDPPEAAPSDATAAPRTADDYRRMVAAWQAMETVSLDFANQVGSGDPAALNQQLGRLREAMDGMPEGMGDKDALGGMMALLLQASEGAGGTLEDQALGLGHIETITGYLRRHPGNRIVSGDTLDVMADLMGLMADIRSAWQAADEERLRALVPEAEALADSVPEDHDLRFLALMLRRMARATLGMCTKDSELLHSIAGFEDFEDVRAAAENSVLPAQDEIAAMGPGVEAMRSVLAGDATNLPEREVPPPDATADQLYTASRRLGMRLVVTKASADLDAAITVLERLREHVREGRAPGVAAESLWSLAEYYQARWYQERGDADAAAGTDAANEALATLAADVLLQRGAEHRLTTAREGASFGVRAALWAAVQGKVDDAVAALELGRALVLQAAATSRTVPSLLEERGHPELAAAWRESGSADSTELPAALPSTLRRQALEALGYRERGGLFSTPTLRELADGVREAGADALIYIVPGGRGEAPGLLLAVGPEIGVGMGALPTLSEGSSAPLERYLDAAAARSEDPGGEQAERAWEEALAGLGDWAYEVLVHVLAGLAKHLPGDPAERRTPRVVLVPCGRLGIVPWHAARFPADAPYDYACQALVISYAASGSQFLRTVKRAPRDPVSAPAMVADPSLSLMNAELEVLELRNAFYPGARLYGDFATFPPDSVPAGTPDQLLALLAQDHSMVHLATHGMAGVRPTESALYLAPTGPGEEDGRLTVTRLLDRPRLDEQEAPDGPLIVLSACETDLSTRDHEEALTLTTAFISGGARDVVGSRWTAQDGASRLMMAVFHHHLRDGLSPVDALRATQLWMLDPDRQDPGSLSDALRSHVRRSDLQRPAIWAAFIHQGHPGRRAETA